MTKRTARWPIVVYAVLVVAAAIPALRGLMPSKPPQTKPTNEHAVGALIQPDTPSSGERNPSPTLQPVLKEKMPGFFVYRAPPKSSYGLVDQQKVNMIIKQAMNERSILDAEQSILTMLGHPYVIGSTDAIHPHSHLNGISWTYYINRNEKPVPCPITFYPKTDQISWDGGKGTQTQHLIYHRTVP